MERDYSYASQVNRRLSATRFLIHTYESHLETSLVVSEEQAFIDSILVQLYFACVSYCNELLQHHQKPILSNDNIDLNAVFAGKDNNFADVALFNEFKTLYAKKNSGLAALCLLFQHLTTIGSKGEQEKNRLQREQSTQGANSELKKINLLDIDSTDVDLSDMKTVRQLLQTLQNLIDRQREYLIEY